MIADSLAAVALSAAAGASPDPQYLSTVSGKVRCSVSVNHAVCQRNSADGFPNAPIQNGYHDNIVSTDGAGGGLVWSSGNMPASDENDPRNDIVLTYGDSFHFHGWTIEPTESGTRFTNLDTGHGMFVSIEKVTAF